MMQFVFSTQQNGRQLARSPHPFYLSSGQQLPELELMFETYGQLNQQKDNVVLIHHALSTDSHVQSHNSDQSKGWWEGHIGPDATIDTNRLFVICVANIGSCAGSSGPLSHDPQSNALYGPGFPSITFADIVASQKLLLDALGITSLHAIVSYSLGAMISLTWAKHYPKMMKHLVVASTCHKAFSANIANRTLQRDIIRLDPDFKAGSYQNNQFKGFKLARKLGMLTYRNWVELNERFPDKHGRHSIENYLEYNADKFLAAFDANAYIQMLGAMDEYDLAAGCENESDIFADLRAKTRVIAVDTDVLYPPEQQRTLFKLLQRAEVECDLIEHPSRYGHDAFVIDHPQIRSYIKSFI